MKKWWKLFKPADVAPSLEAHLAMLSLSFILSCVGKGGIGEEGVWDERRA